VALADLELQLRPAARDDADFFYAVRRAGFQPYTEEVFGPWIDANQRQWADRDFGELPIEIVEHRGAPIGYLIILREADHVFLDEIALVPSARRCGLGAELVRAAMDRARDAGQELRLSVLVNNPAQQLYARLGFVITRIEHPRIKMTWTPPG